MPLHNMKDKIIVALDVDTLKGQQRLLDILSPYVKIFKIGMELFYACGPKSVELVKKYDRDVFLDLKFCDIPNTVRAASAAATRLGVWMFNMHASGGLEMMRAGLEAAKEESDRLGIDRPRIVGVTVLTSMDKDALSKIGISRPIEEQVLNLAMLAKESGLDGVVASAMEAKVIKKNLGKDFLVVTPGVRPAGSLSQDQKRTVTPKEAFDNGADYIVIGRPIIKAKDPEKAIIDLFKDIS